LMFLRMRVVIDAAHLVQPSNRDEYELSQAIDQLVRSGRTFDVIRMDGGGSLSAIPKIEKRPYRRKKARRKATSPKRHRPDGVGMKPFS
jgi:dTDP-glucose pyrophosphorylase